MLTVPPDHGFLLHKSPIYDHVIYCHVIYVKFSHIFGRSELWILWNVDQHKTASALVLALDRMSTIED